MTPVSPRALASAACTQRSDRKSTRLNSSHLVISYAVFCLKKKKNTCCRIIRAIHTCLIFSPLHYMTYTSCNLLPFGVISCHDRQLSSSLPRGLLNHPA